jgi:hypothetical protein
MAETTAPKERVALAHGATPITEGGVVNIGTHAVTLPGVEEQKRGFELDRQEARHLLAQFPDRYKRKLTRVVSRQAQQLGQQQGAGNAKLMSAREEGQNAKTD